MHKYSSICDEFYVNMHLNTEMDLPQNRESVLHFFEQDEFHGLPPLISGYRCKATGRDTALFSQPLPAGADTLPWCR